MTMKRHIGLYSTFSPKVAHCARPNVIQITLKASLCCIIRAEWPAEWPSVHLRTDPAPPHKASP